MTPVAVASCKVLFSETGSSYGEPLLGSIPILSLTAEAILAYVQTRAFTLEQLSTCNRHHSLDARIARWLLTMGDRVDSDVFPITQEHLAQLLGTQRTTVTLAAKRLQSAQAIVYSRGHMRILSRQLLRRHACECYEVIKSLTLSHRPVE